MKRGVLSMFLLASFGAIAPASAQTSFYANLTHDQETAPGGTTPLTTATGGARALSYGTATFTLNEAGTQFSMFVTIYNIDITGAQTADVNDNLSAAHIHVGAFPGANAPVRWGFFGTPDNDINPDQLIVTPFLNGVGGTFTSIWDLDEGNAGTTLATNLPQILQGQSYLNFHTTQFPGGEIRGQILVTPEPGTVALTAAGLLTLALIARRRRV